ncbi:MAG: hypothetical protein KGH67_05080, partial [Candidatus Micrarchaeota archaeon]|nr:hypothetical protein [Candidatus Micrarchaeota archaeon]
MAIGFRGRDMPVSIMATSGDELVKKVSELGHDPSQVFLKHGNPNFVNALERSRYKMFASLAESGAECPIGFVREFNALRELHAALPQNVATPIALVKSGLFTVCGYLTEYVDGITLLQLEEHPVFESVSIAQKAALYEGILFLIRDIEKAGLAHGDLSNRGNIIISKSGGIKLIDPMPDSY